MNDNHPTLVHSITPGTWKYIFGFTETDSKKFDYGFRIPRMSMFGNRLSFFCARDGEPVEDGNQWLYNHQEDLIENTWYSIHFSQIKVASEGRTFDKISYYEVQYS